MTLRAIFVFLNLKKIANNLKTTGKSLVQFYTSRISVGSLRRIKVGTMDLDLWPLTLEVKKMLLASKACASTQFNLYLFGNGLNKLVTAKRALSAGYWTWKYEIKLSIA